jgi:tRNA(Ile)-lysidine synthase
MSTRALELPFPVPPDAARAAFAPARWAQLGATAGVGATEPLVLALSGGADSVFLLHLAARARPRPRVIAVHVDHGLRGAESEADVEFCRALCAELDVPLVVRRVALDAEPSGLEERARVARYRALCSAAADADVRTIATGHHAGDALETLLLRWMRGTDPASANIPARTVLAHAANASEADPTALNPTACDLALVRPLLTLRREEVRLALTRHGLEWRDDTSNASASFARNRVRHALIPALVAACGADAPVNLARFGAAIETFERHCAAFTEPVRWQPPRHAAARRSAAERRAGGSLPRAELEALALPLLRRALARLLAAGSGRGPARAELENVVATLRAGATGDWTLPGGWRLGLRSGWLDLDPPPRGRAVAVRSATPSRAVQTLLPFDGAVPAEDRPQLPHDAWELAVPGRTLLPDGRALLAEWIESARGAAVPRSPDCVELDAEGLAGPLEVRWPRPGDRFRPLGAPGSRPLTRFLRDVGVPRHDRGHVPLVCAAREVLWVAGVRPSDARRVGPATDRRLRLSLEHVESAPAGPAPARRSA